MDFLPRVFGGLDFLSESVFGEKSEFVLEIGRISVPMVPYGTHPLLRTVPVGTPLLDSGPGFILNDFSPAGIWSYFVSM